MPQTVAPATRRFIFDTVPDLMLRAGRKTLWPLVDQSVVSAGNFLTLVIVARGLATRSDYGIFGLILECIFYVNTLQSALITYPLTVKGASADAASLRRLCGGALLLTLLMAVPLVVVGFTVASAVQSAQLACAAAFAFFAWQMQEVVRRTLLAGFRYADAVCGDGLRYLGTAACLAILWQWELLTLPNIFFVIGGFSAAAMLLQCIQVGPRWVRRREIAHLAREFWTTGRWMLLSSLSAIVISLCGVWTISYFHGNAFVGDFYAIANFTKPVNPLLATFCGLVVQHAAKAHDAGGINAAKRISIKLSLLTCALTLPYLLLLVAFPHEAIALLYGAKSHFLSPTGAMALRVFSVSFILLVFLSLMGAFMNGIQRTRENFFAQIVNSIATVLIAFPLTIKYGLIGHIVGGTLTAAIQGVSMVHLLRRVQRSARGAA